jgi:hypothetical protein
VVEFGGAELTTALADGGPLANAIARRGGHAPDLDVVHAPARSATELLATQAEWAPALEGAHVVLRSISPDVQAGAGDDRHITHVGETFRAAFAEFIALVKASGASVVVLNGSTLTPDDHTFSYARTPVTGPLLVHQFNLELIRLSMLDGISVLDVDRIVSEEGGHDHVEGLLTYGPKVAADIVDELALVLEEYGWFDDRPILSQRGSGERGAAA